ncbi:MAG: PD40 domain-containing protein, partial [Anaerolineae bacterium]|nr:PD40 domain-containing protein [Anaerolineae bacterium]
MIAPPDFRRASLLLALLLTALLPAACTAPPPGPAPTRPLIAYLAPASDTPHRLVISPAAEDAAPQHVIESEYGITDFAPAPDGARIAFSEENAGGGADLRLLDLASGAVSTLADCPETTCTAPAWHPDGTRLAYERTLPGPAADTPIRPTRVHILNLGTTPPADTPLFAEEDLYTTAPQWSPDGRWLASYDAVGGGILLHDPDSGDTAFLPTLQNTTGAFSPDGGQLVYPEIDFVAEGVFYTHLRLADLAGDTITALDPPDLPASDEAAIWTPDGSLLVVTRRYMDARYTPGPQLYLLAPPTGDSKPLVVDEAYYHGAASFDPAGEWLLFQRLR